MAKYCLYQSPIGCLRIGAENGSITNVGMWQAENERSFSEGRTCVSGLAGAECTQLEEAAQGSDRDSELLQKACLQLDEYFQGKRKRFDLPVRCKGTDFQNRVWQALQKIPYGETRSYEEIAVDVGSPKAQRAVGQANNRNRIMILVPCHRVIHKNGDPSGFACGDEAKKFLLALEKKYKF